MKTMKTMKLYILIKDGVPDELAPTIAAHASLIAHLEWYRANGEGLTKYNLWLNESFKKVVCRVSPAEFERAKVFDDVKIITESSLNNQEVGIVICPQEEPYKATRYYKLWKPNK